MKPQRPTRYVDRPEGNGQLQDRIAESMRKLPSPDLTPVQLARIEAQLATVSAPPPAWRKPLWLAVGSLAALAACVALWLKIGGLGSTTELTAAEGGVARYTTK